MTKDESNQKADGREDAASQPAGPSGAGAADELEQAQQEAAGYLDDLKRLKAEFENYRKRVLKEQIAFVERATARLVEDMLPALDDFELALLNIGETTDVDKLARGVEMVYGKLVEVLRKEGLTKIEAQGSPFDPERHEAVMSEDGGEGDLYVADVLRPGYAFKGRVIRPAMVKVARRREEKKGSGGSSSGAVAPGEKKGSGGSSSGAVAPGEKKA